MSICCQLLVTLNISGNYTFAYFSNFLLNKSVIIENYSNNATVFVKGKIYKDIMLLLLKLP